MIYKTVDDVLTCLQKQYATIAKAMDEAELFAASPNAAAAITALRQDERRVAETIGSNEGNGAELGDQTCLQFVPSEHVHALAKELRERCESHESLEEIEQMQVEFSGAVQELVETIAYQVNEPAVRERLELLAEYFASRPCHKI